MRKIFKGQVSQCQYLTVMLTFNLLKYLTLQFRNMTAVLEEVHRATMMNERASAVYGRLARPAIPAQPAVPAQPGVPAQPVVPAQPAEKLCVFGWDSWPVLTEKAENHHNQRATLSTKHHGNSLHYFLQLRFDVTLE